jgi:hypothetical protein
VCSTDAPVCSAPPPVTTWTFPARLTMSSSVPRFGSDEPEEDNQRTETARMTETANKAADRHFADAGLSALQCKNPIDRTWVELRQRSLEIGRQSTTCGKPKAGSSGPLATPLLGDA